MNSFIAASNLQIHKVVIAKLAVAKSRVFFFGRFGTVCNLWTGSSFGLDWLSAASNKAGMNISTEKTEVLYFSPNTRQCGLQLSDHALHQVEKFKHLMNI